MHRGVHQLSELATEAYERRAAQGRGVLQRRRTSARSSSRATRPRASTWSRTPSAGRGVGAGDEVLISAMEHHSNIVPWQLLCEARGARLRVAPIERPRRAAARRARGARRRADEARVRDAHVERARHDQPGARRSFASRIAAACRCCSTARRRRTTCRSTCRRSTAISTSPPATSSTARPGSACSTARKRCSRRCRRSSAAAT